MRPCSYTSLPSPASIHSQFPLSAPLSLQIHSYRNQLTKILDQSDPRIALVIGPCSIHSPAEALEYAKRLKSLQKKVEQNFYLILRAFLEKPRTQLGWKGILYDPHLNGSDKIEEGIKTSRKLLLDLAELGIPTASELLDPLAAPYYSDLLTYGVIGARTAASQPHRQLASSLPFPVGFKNTIHGELEPSIYGLVAARRRHTFLGMDLNGQIASISSTGNRWTHLILRGSQQGPNADPASVERAFSMLKKHHLEPILGIDCSHGNSGKDPLKQRMVFQESLQLARDGHLGIRIVMLESYLERGNQLLDATCIPKAGLSITDPCLSWEETEELLEKV